jgi:hypothetical protein
MKYPLYTTNSAGRVGVTLLWSWPKINDDGTYEMPKPPTMKGVTNYTEKVVTNKATAVEAVK